MPLDEAVEVAKRLFKGDGMNAVNRAIAVGHIGYRSLNGASAQALASLAQYELLETSGKGQVRLTTLALDIIEPQGSSERANALQKAAWAPKLFSELRERLPGVPSENALRAHLIRQKFQASALRSVIPAYLRTCEYVAAEIASDGHGSASPSVAASRSHYQPREPQPVETHTHTRLALAPPIISEVATAGTRREVFALEDGEVVITLPNRLSADSIEDIEAWLEIVARKLRRMAAASRDASGRDGRKLSAQNPDGTKDDPN